MTYHFGWMAKRAQYTASVVNRPACHQFYSEYIDSTQKSSIFSAMVVTVVSRTRC